MIFQLSQLEARPVFGVDGVMTPSQAPGRVPLGCP